MNVGYIFVIKQNLKEGKILMRMITLVSYVLFNSPFPIKCKSETNHKFIPHGWT